MLLSVVNIDGRVNVGDDANDVGNEGVGVGLTGDK